MIAEAAAFKAVGVVRCAPLQRAERSEASGVGVFFYRPKARAMAREVSTYMLLN